MAPTPTPRLILETLFPHLKVAAGYARHIQSQIRVRPAKEGHNFFAEALTDADLSIQTAVEVALLGTFPDLRFYGEEHEQSYNTRYFRSIAPGPEGEYLITLDPIDGTQFYMDGHSNYQIILGILNWDEYEAVIALTPAQNTYCYALRGAGFWQGTLETDLADCRPSTVENNNQTILLGWGMDWLAPRLSDRYTVVSIATAYSKEIQIPTVNGILTGEVAGVVLRGGKFIDGAALAFLAQEAGCIVTSLDGHPLPPLHQCQNYDRSGLAIAVSPTMHQHVLEAIQKG